MLYRKNIIDIEKWLSESKKALLVTGARQVGKTHLIETTLQKNKINYVKFDLIENPEVVEVLHSVKTDGVETLISRLTVLTDKALVPGETVIFFDEIQRFKEIVTKVKYLVEEGSFRYIFSGSLLGVSLVGLHSAPVGFMETIEMFPLDLEEFYLAIGLKPSTISQLKTCFNELHPVDPFVHKTLIDAFYNYLVIGGMPEAVQTYINTHDYNKVMNVHNTIIPQYKLDFTQYESENKKLHLINTYELIPAELNEKNKRYFFSHLDKNLKLDRYQETFEWLNNAGVSISVYNISEPKLPLLLNKKSNLFKLFLSDVGLLSSIYGRATIIETLAKKQNLNYGALFENAVAQELHAHGYKGYFFNSKKQGEIDFVIEHENKCIPIEVKSGKDYSVHSALHNVLSNDNYKIEKAYVLCNENLKVDGKIIYLPIYMVMFFDEKNTPLPDFPAIDLSNL